MLPNILASAFNNCDEKSTSRQVGLWYCYHSLKKWAELPLGTDVKFLRFLRWTEELSCRIIIFTGLYHEPFSIAHKRKMIFNLWLTSSDSLMSSVSSTCTTASAPHGIGAPVVTRITWPGITVWVGWKIKKTPKNSNHLNFMKEIWKTKVLISAVALDILLVISTGINFKVL